VSEVGDVPDMLGLLSADEMIALDENPGEPPPLRPQMLDSIVDKVAARRRRSRWITTAVAAAAAAVLAVGLLIVARPQIVGLQREEARPPEVAMEQLTDMPLQASVALSSYAWGTAIDMTCTYGNYSGRSGAPSELAMLLVYRDGGETTEAATWTARPGSSVTVAGSTSRPLDEIVAVQVVDISTGVVLLQRNL
jgi:hypothetical protein